MSVDDVRVELVMLCNYTHVMSMMDSYLKTTKSKKRPTVTFDIAGTPIGSFLVREDEAAGMSWM